MEELRFVYHDLNNPMLNYARRRKMNVDLERLPLYGPEYRGYPPGEIPHELMAEAVRAYMTNPNYLKTVAPKTAAAIRAVVNSNPRLSKTIQFNTVGGMLAAPALIDQIESDD